MRHIENISDSDESIVPAGNRPMDSLNSEDISIPVESSVRFTSTEESTPKGEDQKNPAKHIDDNNIQFPDDELKDILKRMPPPDPESPQWDPKSPQWDPKSPQWDPKLPPPAPPFSGL